VCATNFIFFDRIYGIEKINFLNEGESFSLTSPAGMKGLLNEISFIFKNIF